MINIGLIRILGVASAQNLLNLVVNRLAVYGINNIDQELSSIVTDGCNVMLKLGEIITPVNQEICYAHTLQLAIMDLLYSKDSSKESEVQCSTNGDEDEYNRNEIEADLNCDEIYHEIEDDFEFSIKEDYKDLINFIRCIVKHFRHPKEMELLQRQVKADNDKEVTLILDNKTRWSSLFKMLERFSNLFDSVEFVLKKTKSDLSPPKRECDGVSFDRGIFHWIRGK